MSIDREKAVERIRKLLNHANDSGSRVSEAEIENYLKYARKLMDEFNVDKQEALQSDDGQKTAYDSIREESVYSRSGRLDTFMQHLGSAVKKVCDVGFVLRTRDGRHHIVFFGLPRDVAVAGELYKELLTAMRVMCKVRYGEARPKEYKHYCLGFAIRLSDRASKETAKSTTTAIVLVKDALLKRWSDENLNLRPGKTRSTKVGNGFGVGYSDGEKVSLDTNQISASNTSQRVLP